MRYLFILSAVLALQTTAFGQQCANGQCSTGSAPSVSRFAARPVAGSPVRFVGKVRAAIPHPVRNLAFACRR